MSDKSLGEIIKELADVDRSMWDNQEILYEIRRMTPQEFKDKYWQDEKGAEKLWEILKMACDLNVERNRVMNAVDESVVKVIKENI